LYLPACCTGDTSACKQHSTAGQGIVGHWMTQQMAVYRVWFVYPSVLVYWLNTSGCSPAAQHSKAGHVQVLVVPRTLQP
jgi:hypothetical protein